MGAEACMAEAEVMREETMREEMGGAGAECTVDKARPGNNDETPNLGVSPGEKASREMMLPSAGPLSLSLSLSLSL
jgi:hypothetical protein